MCNVIVNAGCSVIICLCNLLGETLAGNGASLWSHFLGVYLHHSPRLGSEGVNSTVLMETSGKNPSAAIPLYQHVGFDMPELLVA